MSEQEYVQQRVSALQKELQQIDGTIPQLQDQLQKLSARRCMLQGAVLELQDLMKQRNGSGVLSPQVVTQET